MLRTAANPAALASPLRTAVAQLDAELPLANVMSMSALIDRQKGGNPFFVRVLASFAFLALILAATGLYSVVSYAVTQRTQEMGIRMSLGAQPSSIIRLVLTSTATTLAAGLVVGFALSLALNRIMSSWAGGSSRDPITLVVSAFLLTLVATIACLVPAYRAAGIDPMQALRLE